MSCRKNTRDNFVFCKLNFAQKETALAPLDLIDIEPIPFPKGYVAITASWSHPESVCALHTYPV